MGRGRLLISIFSTACISAALIMGLTSNAYADQISNQSLQLSTSAPGTSSIWFFTFSLPSRVTVRSIRLQVCTTALGMCEVPTGFAHANTTLASVSGLGTGFVADNTFGDSLAVKSTANTTLPATSSSLTFDPVVNPIANEAFFVRMTAYSDPNYSIGIDSGTVAQVTASQVTISATVMEALTLFVGSSTKTIEGDCTALSRDADSATVEPNSASDFVSTQRVQSYFRVITNAGSGVAIQYETPPSLPSSDGVSSTPELPQFDAVLGTITHKTLSPALFAPHSRSATNPSAIVYSTSPVACGTGSGPYSANSSPTASADLHVSSATYLATAIY